MYDFEDFNLYLNAISSNVSIRATDLERYLSDPLVPASVQLFDVLQWWQVNESQYPDLARMACDILAVPATTVASESVSVSSPIS